MPEIEPVPSSIISQPPRVIAHRGASWARPENTRAAFELALAEHCDGIELDLQLTRDDVAVLFHDDDLGKIGLGDRRIGEYLHQELADLDVGQWFDASWSGQRILDLTQLLADFADKTQLFLELKPVDEARTPERAERLAVVVAELLSMRADLSGFSILSFSSRILETVRAVQPMLVRVRNLHETAALDQMSDEDIDHMDAICINIDAFDRSHVARVHAAQRPLYAYTCDSLEQLRHARSLGVSAVITNRPAATRELVAQIWRDASV